MAIGVENKTILLYTFTDFGDRGYPDLSTATYVTKNVFWNESYKTDRSVDQRIASKDFDALVLLLFDNDVTELSNLTNMIQDLDGNWYRLDRISRLPQEFGVDESWKFYVKKTRVKP